MMLQFGSWYFQPSQASVVESWSQFGSSYTARAGNPPLHLHLAYLMHGKGIRGVKDLPSQNHSLGQDASGQLALPPCMAILKVDLVMDRLPKICRTFSPRRGRIQDLLLPLDHCSSSSF